MHHCCLLSFLDIHVEPAKAWRNNCRIHNYRDFKNYPEDILLYFDVYCRKRNRAARSMKMVVVDKAIGIKGLSHRVIGISALARVLLR
jgi:hypothetical protein